MLKDEPQRDQVFRFGAWAGTPQALARTAAALQDRVHPTGEFQAIVESADGRQRTADRPEALAELEAGEAIRRVVVRLSDSRQGWPRIHVEFGGDNAIDVNADTENEARAMLDTARAVIRPDVPWWGWFRRRPTIYDPGLIIGVLIALSAWVAGAIADGVRGLLVGWIIGTVVLIFIGPAIGDRLLPSFELHAGRTRWQRFRWGLFTFLAFEVGAGFLVQLLT